MSNGRKKTVLRWGAGGMYDAETGEYASQAGKKFVPLSEFEELEDEVKYPIVLLGSETSCGKKMALALGKYEQELKAGKRPIFLTKKYAIVDRERYDKLVEANNGRESEVHSRVTPAGS